MYVFRLYRPNREIVLLSLTQIKILKIDMMTCLDTTTMDCVGMAQKVSNVMLWGMDNPVDSDKTFITPGILM